MGFTESFLLAAEGWLLSWVVAATPGGRLVWAWLLIVAGRRWHRFAAAVAGRPAGMRYGASRSAFADIWHGRWSGTFATAGAFGALMMLAGPLCWSWPARGIYQSLKPYSVHGTDGGLNQ